MARYRWDDKQQKMVKIADRVFRNPGALIERPFSEQVMEGYKKCEALGMRINGRPAGIKRIWGS